MRQNILHTIPIKIYIILISVFFIGIGTIANAATRTASESGNWNSTTTWGGQTIPTAADDVFIDSRFIVTVNINNAVCASITLGSGGNNNSGRLNFDASSQVTVSGIVTFAAIGNRANMINMNPGGKLICQGFSVSTSGSQTFTPGTGTVELTADNTLPTSSFDTFNNLIISGGTTTLATTTTVNAALTLDGGALSTGATTGYQLNGGILNLSGNSTIALGTGVHTLTFANSNGTWSGTTLNITGWTGTAGGPSTAGQIFFGNNNTGLSTSQLAKISFSGYSAGAQILNTGEVVPLTTSPTLSVSPSSIDFGFVASGSADTQTFTLNGYNLDGTDVTITGSSDFQVSTDGSTFSNSVTISGYGSSISQDIYVQFAPTSTNTNYLDDIVVSGGGALDNEVVAVTGNSMYCDFTVDDGVRPITSVVFGDISNTSSYLTSSPEYEDFTSVSTDVLIDNDYTLTIQGFTNGGFTYYYTAYFDWNQDGDFTDTGERYEIGTINDSNGQDAKTASTNITIPAGASPGNTSMRVISWYGEYSTTPCANSSFYSYGQAEDYTINVIECTIPVTITCPANVTAYTNPVSGLQTYYNFNETSGATASDNAGSNDATLINGATWDAGQICNAVSLDGNNNNYVDLPDGIVSGLNDFTISTWVNWEGTGWWERIFDFGNSTTTGYMFLTPNGGNLRYAITSTNNGAEQQLNGSDVLPGGWHHVAITLNGTNGRMYLDGVEVDSNPNMTINPSLLGNTGNNWIGRSQYADPYLNGLIDEFHIYSRTLSENEIKTLANTGTCSAYPDLGTPSTSGGCGTINVTNDAVMPMSVGTHTVTWTATGGSSPVTCTQTVTVENNYPSPSFTTPPDATYTVEPGNGTAVITTAVSGCDLSYQWQVSTNDGSIWSNISDASVYYSGTQTDELIITDPISDMNRYWYQLVATAGHYCGASTESDPAELIVSDGTLGLITSPGSQCKYSDDVTVKVSASSESYSGVFRWYSDAAGNNLVHTSASNVNSSEYTVTISSTQSYYVEFESGGETSDLTPVTAYVIPPPSLTASVGGTFCAGDTIKLFSDGFYDNLYWEGKNGDDDIIYYSSDKDPEIPDATTDMSGTYTVHASTLSGVNLVTNGDFEEGDVGFTSEYDYEEDIVGVNNELVPEKAYSVTNMPNNVHYDFCDDCPDKTTGSGLQMVINGSTVSGDSIWMQKVNVVPNTDYQFSYFVQSVPGAKDESPSELQFYVNGNNAGQIYTADSTTGLWTQFFYNWNSGTSTEAYISLVNRNTQPGGNDFALDDIVFQHTCTAEASVDVTVGSGFVPDVTISADPGETICDGDLVTFTATPVNGGTTPSYQWYINGTALTGETSDTYATNSITDGYNVSCEMTSSLACISGSPTVASSAITMSIVTPATASAGANLTSCGTAVVITNDATASDYNNVEWTTSGTGVFSDETSLSSCTYTPSAADISAGSVSLTLTAYGNSPCGDAVSAKTLTFVDPIDISVASNNTNYCPQFLPPVSFNNDDDPRSPGYTEVQFTVTRNNTSAAWTIFTDFTVTATPSLSGQDVENVVVYDEGNNPITVTGTNQYNIDASNSDVTISAQVLNQPGHSLEVGMNIYDVEDANGCQETETANNDAVVDIYTMPAIGRFE